MTIVRSIFRYFLPALLLSAVWATGVSFCGAAERRPKPHKIRGLLTAIESGHVTIRDKKGREVSLQTPEDFREKVTLGVEVTALYYLENEVNKLDWLYYPPESSFVSTREFVPRIKRIILLPSSGAGDAEALYGAIEEFLQTRLNWIVSHRMLAEEIRHRFEKANTIATVIDPAKEDVDLARYTESRRELMRRIASETRADAVLETQIELVMVKLNNQTAFWDDVREPIASKTARVMSFISPLPIEGQVPASTAVLKLWDAEGNLLWRHRRGFCVLALEVGMSDKFRDRPIAEAVENTEGMEKWLNLVFGSWLEADSATREASRK